MATLGCCQVVSLHPLANRDPGLGSAGICMTVPGRPDPLANWRAGGDHPQGSVLLTGARAG